MKFLSILLVSASLAATVKGAQVEFFSNKACDSASQTYRGNCNFCADPPGGMFLLLFIDVDDAQHLPYEKIGVQSDSRISPPTSGSPFTTKTVVLLHPKSGKASVLPVGSKEPPSFVLLGLPALDSGKPLSII